MRRCARNVPRGGNQNPHSALKRGHSADYARLTPVGFEEASKGNAQALRILHEAAKACG